MTEVAAKTATQVAAEFRQTAMEKLDVSDLSDGSQFERLQNYQQGLEGDKAVLAGLGTLVKVEQLTIEGWQDFKQVIEKINTSAGDVEIDVRFGDSCPAELRSEIEQTVAEFALTGNIGAMVDTFNAESQEKLGEPLQIEDGKRDFDVKVSRFEDKAAGRGKNKPVKLDVGEIENAMRDINNESEPIQGHVFVIDSRDEVAAAEKIATALLQVKTENGRGPDEAVKASTDFRLIVRPGKDGDVLKPEGTYAGFEMTAEQLLQRTKAQSAIVQAALSEATEAIKQVKRTDMQLEQAALAAKRNAAQKRRLQEQLAGISDEVKPEDMDVDESVLAGISFDASNVAEAQEVRIERRVKSGLRISLKGKGAAGTEEAS